MLRECARYEALAKIMLYSDEFFNFFRYVEVSTFDIASDAFSTFKVGFQCYLSFNELVKISQNHVSPKFFLKKIHYNPYALSGNILYKLIKKFRKYIIVYLGERNHWIFFWVF